MEVKDENEKKNVMYRWGGSQWLLARHVAVSKGDRTSSIRHLFTLISSLYITHKLNKLPNESTTVQKKIIKLLNIIG